MSTLVDQLADLTGLRDRDVLDVTLVSALRDLMQPRFAAIYRVVGEAPDRRWMTRARLAHGDVSAQTDSLFADLAELPLLDSHAERVACLQRQEAFTVEGTPPRAFFPLANEFETTGVLELHTDAPLGPEQVRLVCSILRIAPGAVMLPDPVNPVNSEQLTAAGIPLRR